MQATGFIYAYGNDIDKPSVGVSSFGMFTLQYATHRDHVTKMYIPVDLTDRGNIQYALLRKHHDL
ncbi:hypothetical protein PsorP6_015518 [Peronosclerospora sorghi]|uniref:Uncharacterized protein n=1 Tax=Peronosclerospora sorghi TaxID=230839 RepID=A0ACC0WNB7_9STRA|nr:hypothetical protein PsorP6_015518 [Peronosclerospora sorghi]